MFVRISPRVFWLGLILLLPYFSATAADSGSAQSRVFVTSAGAIGGFDPVAYFEQGKPIRGEKQFSYQWSGATWYFSNERHRDLFADAPTDYAPRYGGYCAFAMSKGSLAPTDASAWTIHQGKLYLNYSKSVRHTWKKNISENVKRADKHWLRLGVTS